MYISGAIAGVKVRVKRKLEMRRAQRTKEKGQPKHKLQDKIKQVLMVNRSMGHGGRESKRPDSSLDLSPSSPMDSVSSLNGHETNDNGPGLSPSSSDGDSLPLLSKRVLQRKGSLRISVDKRGSLTSNRLMHMGKRTTRQVKSAGRWSKFQKHVSVYCSDEDRVYSDSEGKESRRSSSVGRGFSFKNTIDRTGVEKGQDFPPSFVDVLVAMLLMVTLMLFFGVLSLECLPSERLLVGMDKIENIDDLKKLQGLCVGLAKQIPVASEFPVCQSGLRLSPVLQGTRAMKALVCVLEEMYSLVPEWQSSTGGYFSVDDHLKSAGNENMFQKRAANESISVWDWADLMPEFDSSHVTIAVEAVLDMFRPVSSHWGGFAAFGLAVVTVVGTAVWSFANIRRDSETTPPPSDDSLVNIEAKGVDVEEVEEPTVDSLVASKVERVENIDESASDDTEVEEVKDDEEEKLELEVSDSEDESTMSWNNLSEDVSLDLFLASSYIPRSPAMQHLKISPDARSISTSRDERSVGVLTPKSYLSAPGAMLRAKTKPYTVDHPDSPLLQRRQDAESRRLQRMQWQSEIILCRIADALNVEKDSP
eukprot:CAMPEP_0203805958 /NCGR_PEP_ID=MMETSP0100_2-20121128/14546_1 /ASSEMBLY_ACC=CAM_ASM_000210 /TAXON_ID=96639 /ORGANISM=" , Strain NY0313808BC1" /LENGTH=590 /DNA_ID=CAMNT_0050714579 /DNA_START=287 /DNA_END=2056 /DNA_ORIENTATION=-